MSVLTRQGHSRTEEQLWTNSRLTMAVRNFLKKLDVTAQRETELTVREQLGAGQLRGDETLDATATVVVAGLPR